jgi:PAS domain S-box-containing protein
MKLFKVSASRFGTIPGVANLFQVLIDTLPDYIYVKDREHRFILVNQAIVRALGASRVEDVIGKTDFDFHPRTAAEIYYEDERPILELGQALYNWEEIVLASKYRGESLVCLYQSAVL